MKVLLVHSGNAVNDSDDYTFVKEQGCALTGQGVDVTYFAVKGKGPCGYLKNLKRLKAVIAQEKPDIVHAHYGLCGALCVLQRKVPVVVTFHNGETLTRKGKIVSIMAARLSKYRIYVAQHIFDKLVFQPSSHFFIQPCGIWLDQLPIVPKEQTQKALGLSGDQPNILFGGSFSNDRKNYPLAQQAISLLPFEVNLIEMKGYSREEVNLLYCACDLLLLPTKSEGSPQVIKEAMACNCPVVATNVADIAWLLDGVTNSYVTSFDAQEIAHRIEEVLNTKERTNGRQRIEQLGLDNPAVAEKIINVYEKVLRKNE